ncbi:MAG: GNAT family N-acetyltransferase [Marinisporobacter sp.]|jgi:hypothetical protein|nr:GNAT family N-acetyltransferase [Marinisporobacter sp.]
MKIKFIKNTPIENIPIYYSTNYNTIFSENDDALYKNIEIDFGQDKKVFIPILLKEIEKDVFESYSAYGYSGFYSQNLEEKDLLKENFHKFKEFMKENKIINMFLRNSPYLCNENFIDDNYNFFNRKTYSIRLQKYEDIDDFARQIKQKVRWSINYARRNHIKIYFKKYKELNESELKRFYDVYVLTMNHRDADEYYQFSYDFFKKHFDQLKDYCELALATNDKNEIIAGAMFLLDNCDMVHYHFSALNREFSKYQVMELLLGEAIVRYSKMNKKNFHLGGGLSLDESDGLSRFKKKFSTEINNYYISKIIFDHKKYTEIREKYGISNNKMFLIKDAIKL